MRKIIKKSFLISIAVMCLSCVAEAQEKIEATLGTDVVSAYIWRGQKFGSFSLQPTASLSWRGLSLEAWGSFAVCPTDNGSDEELDISLGYEVEGFHVGITDYYMFGNGAPFFLYRQDAMAHTFEANVGYDFGFLSVNWYTNFAGADGVNGSGRRAYSSYLQLDAPFHLAKLDWTASLGVVPYGTDFYEADQSHGFHVNQIALRAEYPIQCRQYQLPVFAQLMVNPSSRDLHYMIGFTITAL